MPGVDGVVGGERDEEALDGGLGDFGEFLGRREKELVRKREEEQEAGGDRGGRHREGEAYLGDAFGRHGDDCGMYAMHREMIGEVSFRFFRDVTERIALEAYISLLQYV